MNAINSFVANCAKAQELATEILEIANDHLYADPDNITWANAGDAQRLVNQLSEILESLKQ